MSHAASKQIVRGSDVVLTLTVRTSSGDPLDLADATGLLVRFKKTDKTALVKLGEQVQVVNAVLGKLRVTLSETDTALLAVMQNAPIEIVVDFGATRRIAQIKSGLNVVDRLF